MRLSATETAIASAFLKSGSKPTPAETLAAVFGDSEATKASNRLPAALSRLRRSLRFRGCAADRRGARRGLSLWGPLVRRGLLEPSSLRRPLHPLRRSRNPRGGELRPEPGERGCLIGRNGAGKSTLLSILSEEVEPDGGTVQARSGLRVGTLPQALPESALTVRAYLREALAPQFERLAALEALSAEVG